ncbi:MAG: hypothetical protein ACREV2_11880 [Burkholderiales bacterium]
MIIPFTSGPAMPVARKAIVPSGFDDNGPSTSPSAAATAFFAARPLTDPQPLERKDGEACLQPAFG